MLSKISNKFWSLFQSDKKCNFSNSFFRLSQTCQIPRLGLIYEQYFRKITNGTFVEIGAFDGEYASNTSGLADIGWSGLYVEPVPEFYDKCLLRHAKNLNVKVVNTAVGEEEGTLTLSIGGPLTTADNAMIDNFKKIEWAKSSFRYEIKINTSLTTLHRLLVQAKIDCGFEVLVIDVEGFEWNVLKAFDINKWHPQMVIIELHDQNDDYFIN